MLSQSPPGNPTGFNKVCRYRHARFKACVLQLCPASSLPLSVQESGPISRTKSILSGEAGIALLKGPPAESSQCHKCQMLELRRILMIKQYYNNGLRKMYSKICTAFQYVGDLAAWHQNMYLILIRCLGIYRVKPTRL